MSGDWRRDWPGQIWGPEELQYPHVAPSWVKQDVCLWTIRFIFQWELCIRWDSCCFLEPLFRSTCTNWFCCWTVSRTGLLSRGATTLSHCVLSNAVFQSIQIHESQQITMKHPTSSVSDDANAEVKWTAHCWCCLMWSAGQRPQTLTGFANADWYLWAWTWFIPAVWSGSSERQQVILKHLTLFMNKDANAAFKFCLNQPLWMLLDAAGQTKFRKSH